MEVIVIDIRMINHSGIGTYLRNLIPIIVNTCHDFQYIFLGPVNTLKSYEWANQGNVDLINCNSMIYSIKEQVELGLKLHSNISLFWSPHYNIPLLYRGNLLVTVHDLFHLAMPDLVKGFHKRLYAKTMFSQLCRRAKAIICISEFTKNELIRLAHCKEDKIRLIPNGVDQSWRYVKKQNNPYYKPFFLFVGNVKPHKNIKNLIRGYALIKDQIEQDLIIVGKKDGFLTGDDEAIVEAGKLGSRINFSGFIDNETLIQYYKNADALVFPSLYEGFGLPPLEAMICGCPIIVSNKSSLPEVCGDAALYCDPYSITDISEKMIMFSRNSSLRETLVQKGYTRAERFSWEECAKKTISVIQEILA